MPVVTFPILAETLTVEGQDPRGDMGVAPLRQDEETNVVGPEMKAAEAQRRAPADPGIARSALQGGRTPAPQGHPLLLEEGYVAEGLSDNRAQAQIVVGPHQVLPSPSFLAAYGTDDDGVERDSLGTAIGCCLVHAGRLPNPRGNWQFKIVTFAALYF